jgi:hypothetical protein
VLLSRNVLPAILVQLERHGRHPDQERVRPPTPGPFPPLQAGPCTTLAQEVSTMTTQENKLELIVPP